MNPASVVEESSSDAGKTDKSSEPVLETEICKKAGDNRQENEQIEYFRHQIAEMTQVNKNLE